MVEIAVSRDSRDALFTSWLPEDTGTQLALLFRHSLSLERKRLISGLPDRDLERADERKGCLSLGSQSESCMCAGRCVGDSR